MILERLASGDLNLTTIRLLAPHLTPENHLSVLDEARGKKKSAVEEMVARLSPWPDEPVLIRKLPAARVISVAVPLCSAQPGSAAQSRARSRNAVLRMAILRTTAGRAAGVSGPRSEARGSRASLAGSLQAAGHDRG